MSTKLEIYAGKQPLPVEKKMWSFRKQMKSLIDKIEASELPDDESVTAYSYITIANNSFASLEISLNGLLDLIDECNSKEVCHG